MRRVISIITILLIITVLTFVAMQLHIRSIVTSVYSALLNRNCYIDEEMYEEYYDVRYNDENINYIIFNGNDDERINYHFNLSRINRNYNEDLVFNASVKNVFSLHDFKQGYIWLTYSITVENDGKEIYGSINIPVTMKIEFREKGWVATQIWEPP